MVGWSLEKFIPPPTPCPGAPRDECFFVFYAQGTGRGEKITFWIACYGKYIAVVYSICMVRLFTCVKCLDLLLAVMKKAVIEL